ncbi:MULTISPECIES: RidA family protein [Runella]|uniref:2-iminobutanoate/2-iminopropanoate deaminase n=1 Tax=Runella defluvii TaxID=370973 RepID=A0A7W5ZFF7_9BACT|nr:MULTISPECIES: RidA family protein [Runella]AYQ36078.1 RidA family protein [Runella sp. SP2]MBB3836241.1 2-iminobutanoate/2-iminopropanoate deaminase [Runella defluvii]HAK79827.1 reactive intermediate/imine deaminase [Runella sp.]HAO51827.1 reactive intermediate/imine deaminase [Runella sp.]
MSKKIIFTTAAPSPIGPYSQAVMVGDTLYVSGQIPIDPDNGDLVTGNIENEARQVMLNIGAILKEAGLHYHNIIKTSIFLKDMNNFGKVNEVYGHFFSGHYPARETVEVSRLPKDVNVEISVIAVKD